MKITVSYKNIAPAITLKTLVEEKIGSLSRFLKDDAALARVEVGKPSRRHHRGDIFYAEANISTKGALYRAEATHADVRSAITEVKRLLHLEITKKQKKKKDTARTPIHS